MNKTLARHFQLYTILINILIYTIPCIMSKFISFEFFMFKIKISFTVAFSTFFSNHTSPLFFLSTQSYIKTEYSPLKVFNISSNLFIWLLSTQAAHIFNTFRRILLWILIIKEFYYLLEELSQKLRHDAVHVQQSVSVDSRFVDFNDLRK